VAALIQMAASTNLITGLPLSEFPG
jgi:hypothetical protein